MKKALQMLAVILCIALLPAASAEESELCLTSVMFQTAEFIGSETFEEGYSETLSYDDGNMFIELLGINVDPEAEFPMIGEETFEDLLEKRYEGDVREWEEVECEPISHYPTRRVRFETGGNEDAAVVDAVAVWTEAQTFVFISSISADAYYGYTDRYTEGEAPAMVDEWMNSLEIFDPEEGAAEEDESSMTDITLVADFSMGSEAGDVVFYKSSIGDPITVETLANGLSEMTGLDFFVTASEEEGALYVDWQPESTLVAGLDDREQNEEFFFYDVDSLDWFMMDSLYATLQANLNAETVYYTMNGGEALTLPNLVAVQTFPIDEPYMGSGFYLKTADAE